MSRWIYKRFKDSALSQCLEFPEAPQHKRSLRVELSFSSTSTVVRDQDPNRK